MTRRPRTAHQRAFTLVEIIVVLVVILLFAALAAPNLVSMRDGERRREAYGQITDLILEARIRAVKDNLTYAITWDSAGSQFNLKKEPPASDVGGTSTIPQPEARPLQSATSVEQFDQVKSLTVPAPLQMEAFRVGLNNSDSGSWAVHFYPDGTSDGGGFQITSGSDIRSVEIDKYGVSTLSPGQLPDTTDETWTAGTYAQKI